MHQMGKGGAVAPAPRGGGGVLEWRLDRLKLGGNRACRAEIRQPSRSPRASRAATSSTTCSGRSSMPHRDGNRSAAGTGWVPGTTASEVPAAAAASTSLAGTGASTCPSKRQPTMLDKQSMWHRMEVLSFTQFLKQPVRVRNVASVSSRTLSFCLFQLLL